MTYVNQSDKPTAATPWCHAVLRRVRKWSRDYRTTCTCTWTDDLQYRSVFQSFNL